MYITGTYFRNLSLHIGGSSGSAERPLELAVQRAVRGKDDEFRVVESKDKLEAMGTDQNTCLFSLPPA